MDNVLQLFRDALLISEPFYKDNEALWHKWNAYYKDVKEDNSKIVTSSYLSPSFSMLIQWLEKQQKRGVCSLQIFTEIDQYKDEIQEAINLFIHQEFLNPIKSNHEMKSISSEDEEMKIKSYPIETKDSNGLAQLSSHKDEDLRLTNIKEAARWNTHRGWCYE